MPRSLHVLQTPALLALLLTAAPALAAPGPIALAPSSLTLSGPPAAILSADVDGDGRRDLVVLTLATTWEQIGVEEESHMDEALGLVEVLTVVPALLEHRELQVFRGLAAGGFEATPMSLPADRTLLSLTAGPPGLPVLALTDSGVAVLRIRTGADAVGAAAESAGTPSGPVATEPAAASADAGPQLALEPVIADVPVLAGSGTFVPDILRVVDLDGDGKRDVLFPAPDGVAIYLGDGAGLAARPAARVRLPDDEPSDSDGRLLRHYALPEVRDLAGDGRPELLVQHPRRGWNELKIWRGLGGGRFAAPVEPLPARPAEAQAANPSVVFVGDLDGDHRGELLLQQSFEPKDDAGMREELHHAKEPPFDYRALALDSDFAAGREKVKTFRAVGYAFEGGGDVRLPGGLRDLNGDGRLDLVALTLDFSILQAVRVLATKRIGIGLDFHIDCQQADGSFRAVTGLDLSGKFTLDLNDLRIGNLAQFAGDFDGDGMIDFLQVGRGKKAAIHRGRRDCSYPARPDAEVLLREEPADLGLLRVEDYDGDGKSDLLLIQPVEQEEKARDGVSSPVRLDLYLSQAPR